MTRLFLALILITTPAMAEPSIQVTFSPSGSSTEAIVQVISTATKTIHLAGYGFTSKPIAQALIAAHRRGVEVEVVLDKSNKSHRTEAGQIAGAGVPVRVDSRYAIMHDKFIIADGVTVETGSFNYTFAAERNNAENILILQNFTNIAQWYEQEWQRLWAESQPWGAKP